LALRIALPAGWTAEGPSGRKVAGSLHVRGPATVLYHRSWLPAAAGPA
jgi:hypothetical protein